MEHIIERKKEVQSYQVNIDNYTIIADNIKEKWTKEIEQYKGLETLDIAKKVPEHLHELVGDLIFKDNILTALATEKIEQRRAIRIHDALVQQIDKDELEQYLKDNPI